MPWPDVNARLAGGMDKTEKPSLHRAFQPFETWSCLTISQQQQFNFAAGRVERISRRAFHCVEETLSGRNGPAVMASGITTSKYRSHFTHLTD